MKSQRLLAILTVVNLAILVFSLAPLRPAVAQDVAPVLRGRAFEIIDDQGRIRASLSVMPAGKSANGDPYPETVLLRLITERGRPSVKISATEAASGLSFAGPTGTSETYVILEAKGKASRLKLRNEDGKEQIVTP
jgi:hypothetical protein